MNRRRLVLLVVTALSIVAFANLAAASGEPDVGSTRILADASRAADNGETVFRCATVARGRPATAPSTEQIDRWIQENRVAAGGVIPVHVHVIYSGSEGNIPQSQIDAQILVLNRNYAGQDYNGNPVPGAKNTGYTFVLASVDRTNSKQWFRMTPGSRAERNAKNSLAIDQNNSLNLYTAKPGQNLLGWATFPWDLQSNGKQDGVVIHYGSVPGGYLSPYNLGGTATHEVGHWVGLYHTFQGGCDGGNCSGAGDLVCDTPSEGTSTSGCPSNKDTCPEAGLDPVHNYMDYSTDICYNNFTTGQDARADFMMSTYRPGIGSARIANASIDTGAEFRPNQGHGPRNTDSGETVYRCASEARGKPVRAPDTQQIEKWIHENRVAAGGVIPVHLHIITTRTGDGDLTAQQISDQILVLNRNFAGQDYNGNPVPGAANTGYTFTLASVDRTPNNKWYRMTPGTGAESQAKNALAIDQNNSLNLYTCKPGQNLLGWSTFPSDLQANGKLDGVVIHYGSVPGGYLSPYNLGGTATHEVGHWVGLYHTFQGGCDGGNCSGAGDLVCDTPSEGTATSGCPSGKDTCPEAGLDPIHNYMDYSTDICYTNFTTGQDARADFMMSTYRPGIGAGRLANNAGAIQGAKSLTGETEFRAVPNPFNPRTKIQFTLQRESRVSLNVYDVQGRAVATLINQRLGAGPHEVPFNGDRLASGIYHMQLRVDGKTVGVRRITLLK